MKLIASMRSQNHNKPDYLGVLYIKAA